MAKKQTTKKQHTVPRCYLQNFVDANGRLYGFNKLKQKSFAARPKDICYEHFFYDVPLTLDENTEHFQIFEKALCELEGQFPPVLRKVIDAKHIDDYHRRFLSFWISFQYFRTPGARHEQQSVANQATNDLIRQITKGLGIDEEITIEVSPERQAKEHLLQLFGETPAMIAEVIFSHHWVLGDNQTNIPLITSDSPVIKIANQPDDGISYTGFASKGIEILYPFSPRYILQIRERSLPGAQLVSHLDGMSMQLSKADVTQFNHYQVKHSHQFVYSSKDNFAEVRKILQAQPELMEPPLHELEIKELEGGLTHIRPKP